MQKKSVVPARVYPAVSSSEFVMSRGVDVLDLHKRFRDSLGFAWAIYFGLDNLWATSSFYPMDVFAYKSLLRDKQWDQMELILARAGVQYVYDPQKGFEKIPGALPRALVFYRAKSLSNQDEVIRTWSRPEFAAGEVALLEGATGISAAEGPLMPEPAQITVYENERVEVEASAKEDGWLVLLDYYYPGWKARVDGRPAEILRADGFFRAVKIPAGRHTIIFDYHPDDFYQSLRVSEIGLVVWGLLLAVSLLRRARDR
jgi:hypothetical protein